MNKSTGKLFKIATITIIVVAIVVAIPFAAVKLATKKKSKLNY